MTKAERAAFRAELQQVRQIEIAKTRATIKAEVAGLDDAQLMELAAEAEMDLTAGWDLEELSLHQKFALDEAHGRGMSSIVYPADEDGGAAETGGAAEKGGV